MAQRTAQRSSPVLKKDAGLWADLLDVDTFVRVNDLPEVTSPQLLSNGIPNPRGVLSYEIFGTSQEDRKHRFAYIDLHGHYMNPLVALKCSSYDRKLADCLFARGRWKLQSDGTLVEDENGDAGPEFVYSIWGKVKVKEKTTTTTKEVEEFYSLPRDILFITKYPVIPPFTRDLNTKTNSSSKSSAIINSMYNSLISYTQSMSMYENDITNMGRLTRGRIQQVLVDIYKHLCIDTVKGQPAKFGMLNRAVMAMNTRYAARLVITAPILHTNSFEEVQTKFGYATLPLPTVISIFYPFMVYQLRRFFDAQFIEGGKGTYINDKGEPVQITFQESYDENEITNMISRYINSPSSRFDEVLTPPDQNGTRYHLTLSGRFQKNNTTFTRKATMTDIMYIVAERMAKDKHVYCTRFPVENSNGQFPARVIVSSTIRTQPVIIGETVYPCFPIATGDPNNAFVDTLRFSNTMLSAIGGDFDGDVMSVKPCITVEANQDAEKQIQSLSYIMDYRGKIMRSLDRDFILTAYNMTNVINGPETFKYEDINATEPKFRIA